jgi:hypothetical protein
MIAISFVTTIFPIQNPIKMVLSMVFLVKIEISSKDLLFLSGIF